jgi:hypothetical protein
MRAAWYEAGTGAGSVGGWRDVGPSSWSGRGSHSDRGVWHKSGRCQEASGFFRHWHAISARHSAQRWRWESRSGRRGRIFRVGRAGCMVLRRPIVSTIRNGRGVYGGPARSCCSVAGECVAGSGRLSGDTRHHGPSRCACRGSSSGANGVGTRGRRRCRNMRGPARASCRCARDWHRALVSGRTSSEDGGCARSRSQ